jgi:hypothetical protein
MKVAMAMQFCGQHYIPLQGLLASALLIVTIIIAIFKVNRTHFMTIIHHQAANALSPGNVSIVSGLPLGLATVQNGTKLVKMTTNLPKNDFCG